MSLDAARHLVSVGPITCGAPELFLISGPCVIEDQETMYRTAEHIRAVTDRLGIGVIFKSSFAKDNRSSLDYYYGPGLEEGLRILEDIRTKFGMPILSDVHYPHQMEAAGQVLDVIQIPAYLCMQTELVVAAARTGKPVNLKHGQFLAPQNMAKPAEKIRASGNDQIILTERGFTMGYNDLVVDPRAFYHLRQTGYPVVFDVTHSIRKYGIPSSSPDGGARQFLPTLARAGVAAGVDGLFIECHPCPSEALCDAASQLDLTELESFLKPLIELHALEVSYRRSAVVA